MSTTEAKHFSKNGRLLSPQEVLAWQQIVKENNAEWERQLNEKGLTQMEVVGRRFGRLGYELGKELTQSRLNRKKKTSSMKKQKQNGEKNDKPSTDSNVRLFDQAFDAGNKPATIHIIFPVVSETGYTTATISLPVVSGVMTLYIRPPSGPTSEATSLNACKDLERWNWGEAC